MFWLSRPILRPAAGGEPAAPSTLLDRTNGLRPRHKIHFCEANITSEPASPINEQASRKDCRTVTARLGVSVAEAMS